MDVFVELKAIIGEFQAKMAEARGEMTATSAHGASKFESLGKASGMVLGGVAAAAVGIGAASVKMGAQLEEAHDKLKVAIEDSGASFEKFVDPIKNADKAMENLGFTNAQTEEALAVGTTATGSAAKALDLLSVAANLAAYKHTDLATAMVAVAKGSEGNLRPLKQLGIDLPVVASSAEKVKVAQENLVKAQTKLNDLLVQFPKAAQAASKEHAKYEAAVQKVADAQTKLNAQSSSGTQIIDALRQRMGGQAADAAKTFAGRMEVAKARLEDLGARIGIVLIPILEQLAAKIAMVVGWFQRHKAAAEALAVVIGGVLSVAITVFVANKLAMLVKGVQGVIGIFQKMGTTATEQAAVMDEAAIGPAGFATKFGGALSVMAAGVISFQGTTALLKSNFLGIGDAVNSAAKSISDFFGGVGQVKPSTSLSSQAIAFYISVAEGVVHPKNITVGEAQQALHDAGVPGYAQGGYVPRTGLALLHAGETVVPAGAGGGGDLIINLDGREFARVAGPALRSWFGGGPNRNARKGVLKT